MSNSKITSFYKVTSMIALFVIGSCYQNEKMLKSPYPPSEAIKLIKWNMESHKRMAVGSDIWGITWGEDGHQYAVWGDGGGFYGDNDKCRVNIGVSRIEGDSNSYIGFDVFGKISEDCKAACESKSERWGFNLITIDNIMYMFTETHQSGAELYYSEDSGCSWKSAGWKFGQNNEDVFSRAVFLNMGKNYYDARDEYLYIYAPEIAIPWSTSRNTIELARVPKGKILQQKEYQFFSGLTSEGQAKWDNSIGNRKAVFEWAGRVAWLVCPNYDPYLKKIILMFNSLDSKSKKTRLAVFEAPNPWGPWSEIGVYDNWSNFDYTFSFWLAPKWWRENGTEFTLVFSGTGKSDSWNTIDGELVHVQKKR